MNSILRAVGNEVAPDPNRHGWIHFLEGTISSEIATVYGGYHFETDGGDSGFETNRLRALGGPFANVTVTAVHPESTSNHVIYTIAFPYEIDPAPYLTPTPGVGWTSSVTPRSA